MVSVVYISSATTLFSKQELLALLEQSRRNNAPLGLTGMLLYKDGSFMQVLEGEEFAVNEIYSRILADPRHHGIIELSRQFPAEREFGSWSMGFRDLSDPQVREMPGYSEFMNQPLHAEEFQQDPTRAQRLLRVFRQTM